MNDEKKGVYDQVVLGMTEIDFWNIFSSSTSIWENGKCCSIKNYFQLWENGKC